jgi:predicted dinucleotide-binding enzyme
MKIGIIGSGHIGGTLAKEFVEHGHEVAISNSRGPDTLRDLAAEIGNGAQAMSAADAAKFGDVVIVSVPFGHYRDVPTSGTEGKVVIDTNNYYPERDGHFEQLDDGDTTSSEMLAQRMEGPVVKAFNSIEWEHLRDMGDPDAGADDRIGIPISGDDPDAKRMVAELIDELGFTAVDAGSLGSGGRKHQPGSPIYITDMPAQELRSQVAA